MLNLFGRFEMGINPVHVLLLLSYMVKAFDIPNLTTLDCQLCHDISVFIDNEFSSSSTQNSDHKRRTNMKICWPIYLVAFFQPLLSSSLGLRSGKSRKSHIRRWQSAQIWDIFLPALELDYKTATELASLPLQCYNKEYPYKMGIVLNGPTDVQVVKLLI